MGKTWKYRDMVALYYNVLGSRTTYWRPVVSRTAERYTIEDQEVEFELNCQLLVSQGLTQSPLSTRLMTAKSWTIFRKMVYESHPMTIVSLTSNFVMSSSPTWMKSASNRINQERWAMALRVNIARRLLAARSGVMHRYLEMVGLEQSQKFLSNLGISVEVMR